jgi:predicted phage terminase large subunit-like protein
LQTLIEKENPELIAAMDQAEIELSRSDFWEFCKTLAPDYYTDEKIHLEKLCETLQTFYERKLLKPNGSFYTKLIIEMPPQHGKSRTLTNFTAWIFGQNQEERVITGSYNDELAQDFSRYTRDIITADSNAGEIVYSDIFPDVKIKRGDASYKHWALEEQFFSYKGTGVNGTVTGKGATVRIIDDPVKSAEVAYNENALDKLWTWYTGTWLSRRGGPIVMDIICNTPWAKKDITGRLLEEQPDEWFKLSMPVMIDGEMLCDTILDREAYAEIEAIADPHILAANYLMQRLDIKGRLYSEFKTYSEVPKDTTGVVSYTDTADEGDDFLCTIVAKTHGLFWYVVDVIYTQEAQEITEVSVSDMLIRNESTFDVIESNNGGRAFARNVIRIIKEKGHRSFIRWFHQSKNKIARILTQSSTVQKYVLFPEDWKSKWPVFYNAVINYQKEGKNKHDDAPDTLTGLVEKTGNKSMSAASLPVNL